MDCKFRVENLGKENYNLEIDANRSEWLDICCFNKIYFLLEFNENYNKILSDIVLYIKAFTFEFSKNMRPDIQYYNITTDLFFYIELNRKIFFNEQSRNKIDKTVVGYDFIETINVIFDKKSEIIISELYLDKDIVNDSYKIEPSDIFIFLILTYLLEYSFISSRFADIELMSEVDFEKYSSLIENDFFVINNLFLKHFLYKSKSIIKNYALENKFKEIGKKELTAKGGKAKGNNYKEKNKENFRKIEEFYDSKTWKSVAQCAEEIIYNDIASLSFNVVYAHLRKYIKSKN